MPRSRPRGTGAEERDDSMTTGQWDPDQYARFRAERSRPFYDLAEMVQTHPGMRVLDLGCGDGVLTAWLHDQLEAGETLGIDSSAEMLSKAAAHEQPNLHFQQADIATFEAAEPFDLVFTNAALQWVDDHETLIPRLLGLLAPGGQFAMQIPVNEQLISHITADGLAGEEPYFTALHGQVRAFHEVLKPERYAHILWERGCVEQQVRLNIYPHEMPGYEAVIEWVKGTYLTSYETRLGPALWPSYLEEYTKRMEAAIGDQRPFLYCYPRILAWGRKG
jgi:trans-aconitate 2-methyltransferase